MGPNSTPISLDHSSNLSSGHARRPANSRTFIRKGLFSSGRGIGNGFMVKKVKCVSTNLLENQSSVIEDNIPSKKMVSPIELFGKTKIQKKTRSMVFLTCELKTDNKIIATASGVWKILKLSGAGPGG